MRQRKPRHWHAAAPARGNGPPARVACGTVPHQRARLRRAFLHFPAPLARPPATAPRCAAAGCPPRGGLQRRRRRRLRLLFSPQCARKARLGALHAPVPTRFSRAVSTRRVFCAATHAAHRKLRHPFQVCYEQPRVRRERRRRRVPRHYCLLRRQRMQRLAAMPPRPAASYWHWSLISNSSRRIQRAPRRRGLFGLVRRCWRLRGASPARLAAAAAEMRLDVFRCAVVPAHAARGRAGAAPHAAQRSVHAKRAARKRIRRGRRSCCALVFDSSVRTFSALRLWLYSDLEIRLNEAAGVLARTAH